LALTTYDQAGGGPVRFRSSDRPCVNGSVHLHVAVAVNVDDYDNADDQVNDHVCYASALDLRDPV
jgi:hypothetical protein